MEIEIDCGLRVKINQKDNVSSVIKSPNATGTVIVPRFAEYEDKKYKIISIEENAFYHCHIDLLAFAEGSEVETFERKCFYLAFIKRLKIPPSIKCLKDGWCESVQDLTEIEVSPKNKFYIFYNNDFLLGKSDELSDKFDILLFARTNIEEAVIPAQVTVVKESSFSRHSYLKSVQFQSNSELKSIENKAFSGSSLESLSLPGSLEQIGNHVFMSTPNLRNIEISTENHFFKLIDDKYLVTESQRGSGVFDVILVAKRDIESVIIPSHIKIIMNSAFQNCEHLKTVTFEENSSLKSIKPSAFSHIEGPEKFIIPPSVKVVDLNSFSCMKNVKYIEFLSESIEIGNNCFLLCESLLSVSFPNANQIIFDYGSKNSLPPKILIKRDANLSGEGASNCEGKICFIEDDNKTTDEKVTIVSAEGTSNRNKETFESKEMTDSSIENENNNLKRFVLYLMSRLSKYEEVISYDEFVKKNEPNCYENKKTEEEEEHSKIHSFVGPDDEEFHEVVKKIGEGSTSEVFKIIDKRSGEVMCKKVVKECEDDQAFKTLQNALKEIDISQIIRHPCICESFGYNTQEPLPQVCSDEEPAKTTIALFFELLPYSVKEVASKKLLSNTLKVRIAVEVAFGMSYVHSLGMMHRDLKLENIMMNSVFDSKIIDFGLVHVNDLFVSGSSLTKGIGTLAYMSPEMVNEEDYNNKTDVYSYGVVLFALFTGSLPNQSMRDRLNNVPMEYPSASPQISEYCISLIKKCTSFDPSQRPTFDEIIDDMFVNNFSLSSEVDVKVINHRFHELNRIRIDQKNVSDQASNNEHSHQS